MRTVAPAKINWTLEVLGKREDGYHEIRSVMQTIDLCDEVEVREERWRVLAGLTTPVVEGAYAATKNDLTLKAVRALEKATRRRLPVTISLTKRIPVAAGLGGGSSDAAAVLRCVNELYGLGLSTEELVTIGGKIGSDVPFFVYGGTALVEGLGERVTPLPDVADTWLVVVVPRHTEAAKTKRMYRALSDRDFTDGLFTEFAVKNFQNRRTRTPGWNGFYGAALEMFPQVQDAINDASIVSGVDLHLTGAGPGLYAVVASQQEAERITRELSASDRVVFVTLTLGGAAATAVTD